MDEELYAALMGDPELSEGQQAALAKRLRRQSLISSLALMSGDRALSPWGLKSLGRAEDSANELGQRRQVQLERKRRSQADADQKAHWGEVLRQTALDRAEDRRSREQIAAEGRALRETLARIEAGKQAQEDQEKADAKKAAADEKAVAQLGTRYNTLKVPQVEASIGMLNDRLKGYEGKGTDPKDIPGIGYLQNTRLGMLFKSDEGKEVYSDMMRVGNDLLNMYSGLAVTNPEAARREMEELRSWMNSPEDYVKNWPNIVQRYNTMRSAVLGGYSPEIQQKFFENRGMGSRDPLVPAYQNYGKESGLENLSEEELRAIAAQGKR